MASFCSYCGRPLADGEVCGCQEPQTPQQEQFVEQPQQQPEQFVEQPQQPEQKTQAPINMDSIKDTAKGLWERFKNQVGIGDPELNKGDAFEEDKQIVPECVKSNENEIPVKQYEVATLQSRVLGIPFAKAKGRLQVTNKRLIFRAPGRTIAGRTTLQHEFAIDEVAGVEARREYAFNFGDLLLGIIVALLGGLVVNWLGSSLVDNMYQDGYAWTLLFTLAFGIAGFVPFFVFKKKWLLKLLCIGGSLLPLFNNGSALRQLGQWKDQFVPSLFGTIFMVLFVVGLVIFIFNLLLYAIKPNLVLVIKTKAASEAINIRRKKFSLTGGDQSENTGYNEVLPGDDAELCIREINAMVNDIQKLGDFGIEKWKK